MNKLLVLRLKNKLTVEQLANKAGVSPTTITRLENDALKSHALTVAKIAEALGVEVTELSEFISRIAKERSVLTNDRSDGSK